MVYGDGGDGMFDGEGDDDAGGGVGVVTVLEPKEPILCWT